jgi:hypothetical protein
MTERTPSRFEDLARLHKGGVVRDLARFLWQTKKWWMIPIVVTLLLLGALVLLSSTAAAPFIYTLF